MISNGRLEITTQIGCRMACRYCPQKLLVKRYTAVTRLIQMSLPTFKKCIDKIPVAVRIDFSGFGEPWQNPDCTKMLLYAARRGHPLAVYSTLSGMHPADLEAIRDIAFESFVIHLPDDAGNSKIPLTPEYWELLGQCLDVFSRPERHGSVGGSCHGHLRPEAARLIPEGYFSVPASQGINFRMIDRAGLLDEQGLAHSRLPGRVMCSLCRRQLNHNVLLPDGSVVLCCMDYGLEYILGNLIEDAYDTLFRGPAYLRLQKALDDEAEESPCRQCHNAAVWTPGYRLNPIDTSDSGASRSLAHRFAHYLAQKSGAEVVAEFAPDEPIASDADALANTLVFCPDGRAHIRDAASLAALGSILNRAPAAFMYLPDLSPGDAGSSFETQLQATGLSIDVHGVVADELGEPAWAAVLRNTARPQPRPAPSDFRVIALIAAYNETDIIAEVMRDLVDQGIGVYLIDNWSSDGTFEAAEALVGHGLVGRERFPADGPAPDYNWTALLRRKEELARTLDADWFIHVDADELRESPWPALKLKDAFYRVDQEGYNCADHTVIDFPPVTVDYPVGTPLRQAFKYFEFGLRPGHFQQIKAWKNLGQPVDLSSSGGHVARFDGARVYPYKFLLRHYPFRSQAQAEKKVFTDRKARWNPAERARGWHIQYEPFVQGQRFVLEAGDLLVFDDHFHAEYLIERLSGIGAKERQERAGLEKWAPKLFTRLASANVSSERLLAAFADPCDPVSEPEIRILKLNLERSRRRGENEIVRFLEDLLDMLARIRNEGPTI